MNRLSGKTLKKLKCKKKNCKLQKTKFKRKKKNFKLIVK